MTIKRQVKTIAMAGAATIALTAAMPAFAQDDSSSGTRTLGKVTVTATRRDESIQDVPIAVTALSPEVIERSGMTDLRQLDNLAASFNMNSSQTESQGTVLRIRGIGTTGNNIGLESAVGIFIDGVYQSRPGIALGDLIDLQQIEVLRGPQGTLFGRNTTAGALNITTKPPSLDTMDGFANAGVSNFNGLNFQGGVSLPLVEDQFAIRVSGAYRKRDGFIESTTGAESMNRDRFLLRGQALWEPNPDVSIRLIADYSEANEQCCDAVIIEDSSIVAAGAFTTVGLGADGGVSGSSNINDRESNASQFENPFDQWGISGQLDWSLGDVNLTYIGAYRDFFAESVQDSDFVTTDVFVGGQRPGTNSAKLFDEITIQTHELRLQGVNGRLDWLIGGYYSDEDILEQFHLSLGTDFAQAISANFIPLIGTAVGTNPLLFFTGGVDPAGSFATNRFTQNAKSISVFTHNTFAVTDQLDFTVGLRYTDEDKDGAFNQIAASSDACIAVFANAGTIPAALAPLIPLAAGTTCFPFAVVADLPGSGAGGVLPTPVTFDENFSDNELIYTVKAAYEFTPNINSYASYSHGFKAGGFNLDPTAAVLGSSPQFGSETINAFEVGLKTNLFEDRVRANIAVFHQDVSNFQVLEFTGIQFVTFNVDKAKSTGAEFEMQAQATDEFSFNTALTYQDARYPDDCAGTSTVANVVNLCGADLTNAPAFVGLLGATYEDDIAGSSLSYFLNGSVRYETKRRTSTQPSALGAANTAPLVGDFQGANAKVNLRIGIGSQDDNWGLELWANNVFDEQTKNVTFNIPLRGSGPGGTDARGVFIQAPRTYGATVRTKF